MTQEIIEENGRLKCFCGRSVRGLTLERPICVCGRKHIIIDAEFKVIK